MSNKIYCFDTNSLIEPWTKYYSYDMHPAFWKHIELLIKRNRLITSSEVYKEVERKQDSLKDWMKVQKELLVRPITLTTQHLPCIL